MWLKEANTVSSSATFTTVHQERTLAPNMERKSIHLSEKLYFRKFLWIKQLSITNWTKLVEVMEFQLSYVKSWKMMQWKCCTQYASKFGKLSSGYRAGKRSVFIPIPKKGNVKECSNYCNIALISHASKVMLNILQARLQQYVKQRLKSKYALVGSFSSGSLKRHKVVINFLPRVPEIPELN